MTAVWESFVVALAAVGWTEAGHGRAHVRLAWPDGKGSLMVPTDPTAPEYDEMLDAAIDEVGTAAHRGAAARQVIDRLRAEGAIS